MNAWVALLNYSVEPKLPMHNPSKIQFILSEQTDRFSAATWPVLEQARAELNYHLVNEMKK